MTLLISPNFVVAGVAAALPPFPLTHARIGYRTICTADNVVASSQAAGCPAEDAVNIFTNEYWKPAVMPATWTVDAGVAVDSNYIGIAAHTLGSSGVTVKIHSSTDAEVWTERFSFAPANNATIMLLYGTVSARYWRLTVSGATAPRIGVIYIGEALEMMRPIYGGHGPLTLCRNTTIYNQLTEGGQFNGRSVVRGGLGTTFSWKNLDPDWYRQYFDPFVEAAIRTPFFIAWRPQRYPNEVGYVWVPGGIKPSNMGVRGLMEVSMDVVGVGHE